MILDLIIWREGGDPGKQPCHVICHCTVEGGGIGIHTSSSSYISFLAANPFHHQIKPSSAHPIIDKPNANPAI